MAGPVRAGSVLVGFQWSLCRAAGGHGRGMGFAAGGAGCGRMAVAGIAGGLAYDGESVVGAVCGVAGIEGLAGVVRASAIASGALVVAVPQVASFDC